MGSRLPAAKKVNDALRAKKGGAHEDRRPKIEERIQNKQVLELILRLRERQQEQDDK